MIETVLEIFAAQNWACERVPGQDVVEAGFDAHHARVPLHVQTFDRLNALTVVSRSTLTVPPSHFAAASELLWRINRTLTVGNFELDPDAGTPLFRATNLFPAEKPDAAITVGLVHAAVAEMDRLTPYLSVVLNTPEDRLPNVSVANLLANEDLIPPPPEPSS